MSPTVKAAKQRHNRFSGRTVRVMVFDARMTQERHDADVIRRGSRRWGTVRVASFSR